MIMKEEILQRSIDPAAQFMLAVAEKERLETAWHRFENSNPSAALAS